MNLFKKKTNEANTISHVLNKKKRKFPEPIITIRQIEEKDVNEVRQLLHDHFNSLTLPAVVYWSIQHIYDLLVITAINYIFFLDIRKICYFLGIFVIYLYIRAKLEFLRHIRKDCPDLDNLYKSYVNVEGCNFWVAEVFDYNSDSVSRTTCSDIYEREKVIYEHEKEEQIKVLNNDRENESVHEMNSGDEETFKNEQKYETHEENATEETFQKLDENVDEKNNREFKNGDLNRDDEWKFDEHNEHVKRENENEKEKGTEKEQVDEKEEKEKKRNEDEHIDIGKNDENNITMKSIESDKQTDKTELQNEERDEKNHLEDSENAANDSSCKRVFDDSKNKSTNDLIEEMKNNKMKDANSYAHVYYEISNHDEENKENKENMQNENSSSILMEDKEKELKLQNNGETVVDYSNKYATTTNNNMNNNNNDNNMNNNNNNMNNNNNNGNSLSCSNSSSNGMNNSRMKDDEENNIKYINRKIVGCVGIVPYKGDNSIAQLVRMVVKKDNRRMRIGSRLLTQLENFAHEQNYKELKVFTNNLNTDSLYFVKQHGFNLSQIVRRGLMRGDLLIWSKILNKDEFYKFSSTDLQSYTTNILD